MDEAEGYFTFQSDQIVERDSLIVNKSSSSTAQSDVISQNLSQLLKTVKPLKN